MKSTSKHSNITLSTPLETSDSQNLLTRIIKDSTLSLSSNPLKQFISLEDCLLEDLAKSFEPFNEPEEVPLENMMNSFINKYGSHTYSSLDELLEASIKEYEYKPKSVKSLSDILDGLIEDL